MSSSSPAPLADEERELARNRRTLYLLIGGAVSLLLPLLGVVYLKLMDTPPPRRAGPTLAFDHRVVDGTTALRLSPAAAPAPAMSGAPLAQVPQLAPREGSPAPIQGGGGAASSDDSLMMIRGGGDYYRDKPAAQPVAAAAPRPAPAAAPAAAPAPKPAPAVAHARPRPAPKPFVMPHLHLMNTSGYSSFADKPTAGGGQNLSPQQIQALMAAQQQQQSGSGSGSGFAPLGGFGAQAAPAQAQPAAQTGTGAAGGVPPNMAALLKNLPPGTDVSALLKNLPQNQRPGSQAPAAQGQ